MYKWFFRYALTALLLLTTGIGTVGAVTIVDTGPGSTVTGGFLLNSNQWLAAEFSLSKAWIIEDIYGWMNPWRSPGTAHIAIYSDGGELPGREIFARQFSVSGPNTGDWYGLSGLDWLLTSGTYWVSYEVRSGDTLDGAMRTHDVAMQLGNEAICSSGGSWHEDDDLGLGVRILGDPAPVPEPGTLILLGTGLAGLAGATRRSKS